MAVLILALFVGALAAQITRDYFFPSIGTVTTLGLKLYIDSVETPNMTVLNWGNITREVGENVTYYCNATVLNTDDQAWTVYIYVLDEPLGVRHSWAANGTKLNPGDWTYADLELTVTIEAVDGTYSMGTYNLRGE